MIDTEGVLAFPYSTSSSPSLGNGDYSNRQRLGCPRSQMHSGFVTPSLDCTDTRQRISCDRPCRLAPTTSVRQDPNRCTDIHVSTGVMGDMKVPTRSCGQVIDSQTSPFEPYVTSVHDEERLSILDYNLPPEKLGLFYTDNIFNNTWKGGRTRCQWRLVLVSLLLLLLLRPPSTPFDSLVFIVIRSYYNVSLTTITLIFWFATPRDLALSTSFPASGKVLWYRTPASLWSKEYLPIGNGFLAATISGGTTYDETILNIESLWSGGPFQNSSFNGGNPTATDAIYLSSAMRNIRRNIFNSTTGKISDREFDVITTPNEGYGSYTSPGRLVVTLTGDITSGSVTNYIRWLDLDAGVARSKWTVGNNDAVLNRETFCSHPIQACIQLTESGTPNALSLTYALIPTPFNPIPTVSCLDKTTLLIRGTASDPGMDFEILARVKTMPAKLAYCSSNGFKNATILVHNATAAWVTWVGGTNFDEDSGDAAHGFSFKGSDPHATLVGLLNKVTLPPKSYSSLLAQHITDVATGLSTRNSFQLSLGQEVNVRQPTDELLTAYEVGRGDPYLEWLVFEYGRYLLFSSSRGRLPANLQGKWVRDGVNPWGSDYHSNINIQMNYWSAEPTNLDVTASLWNYLEKICAPRGAETAHILYNISRGWVMHNEMNIFGYTGMKGVGGTAQWANYPESAVWFMVHLWDHFDYSNDVAWWKVQGWPLLKGVASFHLDKLFPDSRLNDGSLVVVPCNSPEQAPITFGCAHAQQLIWQMFNAVEKGFAASGDTDIEFLLEVLKKRDMMDKGLRVGSWGQLQEWKFEMDSKSDTHRHLSHLVGLYPGYAISGFAGQTNHTKAQIHKAAAVTLIHRGNGTGTDADAGWGKVWRAACWAQLGNAPQFYHELKYTLRNNFGPNLFSLYDPTSSDPIFQIDANLGYPGAVINAIVHALDVPSLNSTLTITLLPALPSAWSTGSVKGLRMRGGLSLVLRWTNGEATSGSIVADRPAQAKLVEVFYKGKQISSFISQRGVTTHLSF